MTIAVDIGQVKLPSSCHQSCNAAMQSSGAMKRGHVLHQIMCPNTCCTKHLSSYAPARLEADNFRCIDQLPMEDEAAR